MSDLPAGWTETPLEKVVEILDSRRSPINAQEREKRIAGKKQEELFPYYGATGQVGYIDNYLFDEPLILLGEDGVPFLDPMRPKAYLVDGKYWVNNHAHALKAIDGVSDRRYLCAFLNAFDYREKVTGTTRLKLTQEAMRSIQVSLAPLNEQKRIAEKLDTLLARVDSCQTHLERVPQILKRFRQSVLAAATSGRLTEDWREEDNTNSRDFGDFEFSEFPASWNLLPIKEIGQVKGGKRLPNGEKLVDYDTGFPYIRAGQLKKGTVIAEDQLYLLPSTQKKISRYIVDAGDVYITIVGAKIGDAGVVPQNYDKVNLTENAAKICQLSGVDGNYLALWLRSPYAQDIIQSLIKSGAQGKLALTRINEIPVPLPSLEEQAEIVRRVEKLFAYAERLEARYTSASEHVERLTPSLLAKAFRGELVEKEAGGESAEELLKRIRALRETDQEEPKRIKTPRKNKSQTKNEAVMLKKSEVHPDHLSSILKERGALTAEDLWNFSKLEIEDFYEQLKEEEAKKLLKEVKEKEFDKPRFLEAL